MKRDFNVAAHVLVKWALINPHIGCLFDSCISDFLVQVLAVSICPFWAIRKFVVIDQLYPYACFSVFFFLVYGIFRIFSSVLIMYLSCFSLSTLCSAPLSLFITNLCYASSTYTIKEYLVIMLNFFDLLRSVTNCYISRSTCMHNFPSPASSQVLPSDGIICDGNTRAFLTFNVIVVPRIQV